MKTIKVQPLDAESFLPFGFFADLMSPRGPVFGAAPIEFYRDMVQHNLGDATISSYSICRVEKREPIIDVAEYHSRTGEGILPLDGDILLHVGAATPGGSAFPADEIKVFRVPKGTMVVIRPGVWHHAPFVVDTDLVNTLIVLPERTYANDCIVVPLDESEQLRIEM